MMSDEGVQAQEQQPEQTGMQRWAAAASKIESRADLAPNDFPSLMQLALLLQKSAMLPKALRGDPGGTVLLLAQAIQIGVPWTVALKELYVVDGKVSCSAQLLRSLVERDPACKLFYVESFSAEAATVVVQRKEMPEPIRVTFTMKEAQAAGLAGRNPNYRTRPADMMIARASGRAAKAYFPSSTLGLFVEGDEDTPIPPSVLTPGTKAPKSAVAAAIATGPVFGGQVIDAEVVEVPVSIEKDVLDGINAHYAAQEAFGDPQPPGQPPPDDIGPYPEPQPTPDYDAEAFAERVIPEVQKPKAKASRNVPGGGLVEQAPQPPKEGITADQAEFALDLASSKLGLFADSFTRKFLAEVGLQLGADEPAKDKMLELTPDGYRQYLSRVEAAHRKVLANVGKGK